MMCRPCFGTETRTAFLRIDYCYEKDISADSHSNNVSGFGGFLREGDCQS